MHMDPPDASHHQHRTAAESWDREYAGGRYLDEPPVPFVDDILNAAREAGITTGLYIGCGNGRNYLPLVRGGLDLVGLDMSRIAIEQLRDRAPERRERLLCGDLTALPADERYPLVIGIQVFQHGDRTSAHAHIRSAQERVAQGGLMAVRVNATSTGIAPRHEVMEHGEDGDFTVRYLEGPKEALFIHFFTDDELTNLFSSGFEPVVPLRIHSTPRAAPATGQWSQWEGIWRSR